MNTPKRPIVFRFIFGKGLVKARKESENTGRFVAKRIAVQHAEEVWGTERTSGAKHILIRQITEDVRTELIHMSSLFRRFITGAPGSKNGPRQGAELNTVAKGEGRPREKLASMVSTWAERNKDYMSRKRARSGGIGWFDNSKWVDSKGDRRVVGKPRSLKSSYREAGYLKQQFKPDAMGGQTIWEEMFGGVSVSIVRDNSLGEIKGTYNLPMTRGDRVKVQVARIHVMALGKLDLGMLSGFRADNPRLSALVHRYDGQLGVRLGRMNNGVYRPTLEPFLAFFLTRALPHAVSQRIRKGSSGLTSRN